ncbi:MAG: SAM-dependent methyltransferase [Rhodospirillales bacterium]|nr:SAM-dependent methyltransferase [Rhodospirillales bacterium]
MTWDFIILGLVLAAIVSVFVSTLMTAASPLPTSAAVRETMMAMLPADIDGPIYELGSGWGGLAVALAGRYPASQVRAYEVSVLPWAASRLRALLSGPENLSVRFGNFHKVDLSDAALVVCYLPGPAMEKLKPKLAADLKAGALVASNTFALQGWTAADEKTASDIHMSRVYLYRVA